MPNLLVPFTFGHDPQLRAGGVAGAGRPAGHPSGVRRPAAMGRDRWPSRWRWGSEFLARYPQITLTPSRPLAARLRHLERAFRLRRPARLVWAAGARAPRCRPLSSASWWPALLYNRLSVRGMPRRHRRRGSGQCGLAPRDLLAHGLAVEAVRVRRTDVLGRNAHHRTSTQSPRRTHGGAGRPRGSGARARQTEAGPKVFLAVTGAAGLILSLGTHLGPLHTLRATHVPLRSSVRLPVNALILTQLAVGPARGARGIGALLEGTRRPARRHCSWRPPSWPGAALAMLGPLRDASASAVMAARAAFSAHQAADVVRQAAIDLALRALLVAAIPAALGLAARSREPRRRRPPPRRSIRPRSLLDFGSRGRWVPAAVQR